ncbi:extracellular solute-binding protein [Paenibacillus sp. MMS20-IR301]|uniref:extracellular solute-binding protein n=1 Tax=Paenibacillus sp. MMS20-IR301 TaxID=2895946 RepID=UPI0028E78B99|nr:extracellular solute-binding protein [Paenibacillus sp. MMS20-IR301]WNS43859.1 extracellular solute-binding protein [Paenibacillus sp. MMS20-IR301]
MSNLSFQFNLRRLLALGVSVALLLPVIPAAAEAPVPAAGKGTAVASSADSLPSGGKRVLRIGSLWSNGDDTYLRQSFTDLYELTHPDVKLEFVPAVDVEKSRFTGSYMPDGPDAQKLMRNAMLGSDPVDIIIGDSSLIQNLADQNLLAPLQPLIDRDAYDLSNMAPTMLNGVRALGRGHLFALAPTFSASVLYYNKGIFDKAGAAYPVDGMTWDELFALAGKVTKTSKQGEGRIYGFSMSRYVGDPFWDLQSYLSPLQAAVYDNQGRAMTVNNAVWSEGWTTFSTLMQKQIIPDPADIEAAAAAGSAAQGEGEFNPLQGDLFLTGGAAMVIGDYGYLNDLAAVDRNAYRIKNYSPVDWGIAEVPSFAGKPGVAVGASLDNMLAINSTAQNAEDAWELIKYVNSNEAARIKSNNRYQLTSRMDYNSPQKAGISLAPFYNLKPVPVSPSFPNSLQFRMENLYQVNQAGQMLFNEVVQGKRTVANALKAWEQQGNHMLNAMRKDPAVFFNLDNGWLEASRKNK